MTEFQNQLGVAVDFVREYRDFTSALSTMSKPLGLSSDGCLILLILMGNEGMSNTEIADSLGLNLATATKIIDRMVSDNFVHRKPHATDRRRIQIFLTSDGRALTKPASQMFSRFAEQHPVLFSAKPAATEVA